VSVTRIILGHRQLINAIRPKDPAYLWALLDKLVERAVPFVSFTPVDKENANLFVKPSFSDTFAFDTAGRCSIQDKIALYQLGRGSSHSLGPTADRLSAQGHWLVPYSRRS
jgi:hypothetical protein